MDIGESHKINFNNNSRNHRHGYRALACVIATLTCVNASAKNEIEYTDIAKLPSSGIDYKRTKSARDALWGELRSKPSISIFDFAGSAPIRSAGTPGVALLDYDNDGDVDIYVTNGPGSANSLYSNQLVDVGEQRFIDVAKAANVEATESDSTGVCYGDIDNDGDYDLYVLAAGEKNKLYVNNADGTFSDVSSKSDVGGRVSYSSGCSMGDVNGDGLLDIVVANTSRTLNNPLEPTDHNQLFVNAGNNLFVDKSDESGITTLGGFPEEQAGAAGLTWAIAMVDYDQDSDTDIIMVDDQSNHPVGGVGGVKGYIHIMQNDGSGKFSDVTVEAGTNINGAWMGMAFGDINSDGNLDMFVSNIGDYMNAEYFPYEIGDRASRWFLGQNDFSFTKQEITEQNATTFGWGTIMADYDNDGDTDIVYHGSMDGGPIIDASNPGLILSNDGQGNMTVDKNPLASGGHHRRNVQGLAQADINNDGFVDLVSVSNFDIPNSVPLVPYSTQWGGDLDDTAYFVAAFSPVGPLEFSWNGYEFDNGTLAIEINNAANEKGSVSIELLGTAGMLEGSNSNRDGVGAIVSFTPKGGKTVMRPVVAGASYASQNTLTSHFGLGDAEKGMVDVLWPGGTRNRFYDVVESETVRFPEIPCSYAGQWAHAGEYTRCVYKSLKKLESDGQLDRHTMHRLYRSAVKAYVSAKHEQRWH